MSSGGNTTQHAPSQNVPERMRGAVREEAGKKSLPHCLLGPIMWRQLGGTGSAPEAINNWG
jgi:hypothetical protein